MAKKKKQQDAVRREAPLTPRQKSNMFSVLLRSESAFTAACHRLSGDMFSEYERHLAIIWEAAKAHFTRFGELPTYEWLATEVDARLERDPVGITDQQLEELNEFLLETYDGAEPDETDAKVAKSYLVRYINERTIDQLRAKFLDGNEIPTNLSEMFGSLASQAANVEALRGSPIESPFANDWRPKPIEKRSTGTPFFDEFLLGGDVRGEVYGFMGPYGSCKTTLGVMLSTFRARQAHAEYLKAKADGKPIPLGMCYYFFYEDEPDGYIMRALSCIGQIDIETLRNGEQFSTSENLKPYERELFKDQAAVGAAVLGEDLRYKQGERILHSNWRIIDMTGNDPKNPGRGTGLVAEIRDIIQSDLEAHPGTRVDHVVIDYVGAAAKRHAMVSAGGYDNLRHHIGNFPLDASNMIAGRFKTPVYLLHQLSGKKNAMKAGVAAEHTDAAEALNFGENCNFCFQVGKPNDENLTVFNCSKHRRAPPKQEVVVFIDGRFSAVRGTGDRYFVDQVSKRIISADERKKSYTVAKPGQFKSRLPPQSDIGNYFGDE